MKEVICINNKPYPASVRTDILHLIEEGNVYLVVREDIGYDKNDEPALTYFLKGINDQINDGLDANRFIPISEIDETEFIREYKKELV